MVKTTLLVSEAAQLLKAHPESVGRWERRGVLRAKRDYRGFRVFDLAEVLRLKERREQLTETTERIIE